MKTEYLIILWTVATLLLIVYCPELPNNRGELVFIAWFLAILANLGLVIIRYLDGGKN